MTSYKFNVGAKSAERAVADAIGRELASRRDQAESLPQRWRDILRQLDETADAANGSEPGPRSAMAH